MTDFDRAIQNAPIRPHRSKYMEVLEQLRSAYQSLSYGDLGGAFVIGLTLAALLNMPFN